jgi:tetratricopeptide (TPR) repeat protein
LISKKQTEFINKYIEDRSVILFNTSNTVNIQIKNFIAGLGSKQKEFKEIDDPQEFAEFISVNYKTLLVIEEYPESELWEKVIHIINGVDTQFRPAVLFVMDKYKKSNIVKLGQDEIEGIITKPLNQNKMASQIINTIKSWHIKRKYLRFIIEGKALLNQGQFEQAKSAFISSIEHHPKPALSYQLIAESYLKMDNYKEALEHYFKALDINQSHYPSLIGLYKLFMETGLSSEAYKIIKKIFTFYPAGQDELCNAIRLAIQTTSYQDIEKLFAIYIEVVDRSDKLKKHMASALYVLSKFHMNGGRLDDAYRVAHIISGLKIESKRHFFNLVKRVREVGYKNDVIRFMDLFDTEDHDSNEFKMCQFYVSLYDTQYISDHVQTGIEFIEKGVEDIDLFSETIRLLEHVGNEKKARILRQKADKIWPEANFIKTE